MLINDCVLHCCYQYKVIVTNVTSVTNVTCDSKTLYDRVLKSRKILTIVFIYHKHL